MGGVVHVWFFPAGSEKSHSVFNKYGCEHLFATLVGMGDPGSSFNLEIERRSIAMLTPLAWALRREAALALFEKVAEADRNHEAVLRRCAGLEAELERCVARSAGGSGQG